MLKDQINERWKNAYMNKDTVLKSAFECVKAKILTEEKSGKYTLPISDATVVSIISKEVKELKETQSYYNSEDITYAVIQAKINALSEYLPKQMSEEEVKNIIRKLKIQETTKGKLTGMTVREIGNRFDKSLISKLVDDVLAE